MSKNAVLYAKAAMVNLAVAGASAKLGGPGSGWGPLTSLGGGGGGGGGGEGGGRPPQISALLANTLANFIKLSLKNNNLTEKEEQEYKRLYDALTKAGALPNTVNGWLVMYASPTVSMSGRNVAIPIGADPSKWAMREDRSDVNYWATC